MKWFMVHAVGQVVACAPLTKRARVRSPVGTSFLGEFFRGFSSPVRQMSGSFRPPRSPNIIWPSLSSVILHYGSPWPEMLTRPKSSDIQIQMVYDDYFDQWYPGISVRKTDMTGNKKPGPYRWEATMLPLDQRDVLVQLRIRLYDIEIELCLCGKNMEILLCRLGWRVIGISESLIWSKPWRNWYLTPVVNFGEVRRAQLAKATLLTSALVSLGSFQFF